MKTDKNFRLSKRTKTMLALMKFRNKEDRDAFKHMMIGAEATAERARHAKLRDKED